MVIAAPSLPYSLYCLCSTAIRFWHWPAISVSLVYEWQVKKNTGCKWRQNWTKSVCKNSTYWTEFVLNTLWIVLKVLDLLMWRQKVLIIIFPALKGCRLWLDDTTSESVVLTTVASNMKIAVTEKYWGKKCFCLTFDRTFCGSNFIVSLSSQYPCAHLSDSTRGQRHTPSPMAEEQHACWSLASLAEVQEQHLLVSKKKNSHLSPSVSRDTWASSPSPAACLHEACGTFLALTLPLLHQAERKQFKRFQKQWQGRQLDAQTGNLLHSTSFLRKSD